MTFNRTLLLPLASAALLSACAITRVEPPPPAPAPASFKETALWQRAAPAAAAVPDAWWTLFGDPVLDDLQRRLVVDNQNLQAAAARVAGARASLQASRAALWPTLSTGLSASRSDSPATTSGASGGPANSLSLAANAAWEVDLWGRLSQGADAAQATLQATADDLAAARLSAQATLTQTYLSLRAAEVQQALLERSVQTYERSLALTQVRYDAGVVSRSDVLQAQTQLRSAQAQVLDASAQRAQFEHALAVLVGVPPSALKLEHQSLLPAAPQVPPLLPATLLQRRPDIAAAERRVAAAYAQIGVADAAFFPTLSLSANGGYRGSSLAGLVSAPHLFWSVGPQLALSVFDGGQRRAASAQARSSAEQAAASYRQTVLTALQEVEDNLVLAHQLQDQAALQQEAVQAAQRNLEIVQDQYRAGTVSFLNVATAQAALLASENALIGLRNRQLAAVSQLLKNIAGRWEPVAS